jgi:drug/metabolite transporter (DMT)-like permease
MAGFGSLGAAGERPAPLAIAGLLIGLIGVAVLVGAGLFNGHAPLAAYLALLLSPLLWAAGSVFARRHPVSCSPWMASALQMGVTGVVMTSLGLLRGEAAHWTPTAPALIALLYLAVLGSCVAYGAYQWLVHEVTPARLGTYAFVNPAVAVLLGAWMLDEHLQPSQWLGTLGILAGVLLVTLDASRAVRRAS